MKEEIFYPNKLTEEEIKDLNGWKLKIATLHFGIKRHDCVDIGYGYIFRPEKFNDTRPNYEIEEKNTIILVSEKDGLIKKPISLRNEIDWDDPTSLLNECGIKWHEIAKKRILEQIKILKQENN
jgi:hypothetical protein